jgi:hypothetical protein
MYKWYAQLLVIYITSMHVPGSRLLVIYTLYQRRIFIFLFGGGGMDKYLGGAAACFGRGMVATPRKAKEKV